MKRKTARFDILESIRGAAAIYVVLNHLFIKGPFIDGKDFSFLFHFGQEAVILFFLLSGFVIQYTFERSIDKSFKRFFIKRFLRIYIPLIIVCITNYLLYLYQKSTIQIDLKTLLGNIFMLQDLVAPVKPNVICGPFLDNIPLWSLSYEWWFYMVFFFISTYLKKNPSKFVYLVSIISTITYLIYPFFLNRLLMYLVIWWVGVDMARLFAANRLKLSNLKLPILSLLICAGLLLFNIYIKAKGFDPIKKGRIGLSPVLELRHFMFSIIALLAALSWRSLKWRGFKNSLGLLKIFAPVSFVVYISHWFLVINATYLNSVISNVFFRKILYLIICILFSYIIERKVFVFLNKKITALLYRKNHLLSLKEPIHNSNTY